LDAVPQSEVGGESGNYDGDPMRLQKAIVRRAEGSLVALP
jgi:hypothetical protein